MAQSNVLPFERPGNRPAPMQTEQHIVTAWREVFRTFKATHGARLTKDECDVLKGLIEADRKSAFTQWMRGLHIVGKYASATQVRRYMQSIAAPVLDLCASRGAGLSLAASARDEFVAGHAADAAQFPIVERYADCSSAQLLTALRASENHIASLEVYTETVRAELARRGQLVAA